MPDEVLVRDVFPVEVYAPHVNPRPQQRARVFVTTHRVLAWVEGDDRQPVLLLDEALEPGQAIERDRGSMHGELHLATAGGKVHVSKGRGCGCGSVVKALARPVQW